MISEFVEGVHLSDILLDPSDEDGLWLNPALDRERLFHAYLGMAKIMLELYQFDFEQIGAISKDPSTGSWSATRRPLTYSMNELATKSFYPLDEFPTHRFDTDFDYIRHLLHQHQTHLKTQRNLCSSTEEARDRYISRHLFAHSTLRNWPWDNGSFKLFCDDFRPQNVLVDPETLTVKAVLDLEFTNSMPRRYAHEPPWWLLLRGPETALDRHKTRAALDGFKEAYESRLLVFLHAMKHAETLRGPVNEDEESLSELMSQSWKTQSFWFSYAARRPFHVEAFFDRYLREDESLDEQTLAGLHDFIEEKKRQWIEYVSERVQKALDGG